MPSYGRGSFYLLIARKKKKSITCFSFVYPIIVIDKRFHTRAHANRAASHDSGFWIAVDIVGFVAEWIVDNDPEIGMALNHVVVTHV